MSKIGIQWQRETDDVLLYIELVRPRAVMGINCTSLDFWRKVTELIPDAVRVFRYCPPEGEEYTDLSQPVASANLAAGVILEQIPHLVEEKLVTHVLDGNEYVFASDYELHPAADDYMSTFILAVEERGVAAIVLNASCGHFAEETVELFPKTLQALGARALWPPLERSYLGFHEYDWPTMDRLHLESLARGGGGYWLCGKWKRAMGPIQERYGPIQAMITECGLDSGVQNVGEHLGFRSLYPDLEAATRAYFGEHNFRWYKPLLDEDESVFAALIFVMSHWPPWGTFDLEGTKAAQYVINLEPQIPEEPPEPEPPPSQPGGETLEGIRVFEWNPVLGEHVELKTLVEKEALVYGKYGAGFRRSQVQPGQKVYRLTELWEKTGHSSLITHVVDEQGRPMNKVDVAFYWPGAPEPPDPPTEKYSHDWHPNFVHGLTNVNGDVGPGMGRGAYHGTGEGGPHAVWVRAHLIPSDLCEKLGMLAGTFHDHLDQVFQLTVEGDEPGPGPGTEPEPGGGQVLIEKTRETITGVQSSMLYICFPDVESLIHDRRTWAGIKGSNLDLDTSNWERYEDNRGVDWLRSGVCADWAGVDTMRTYWIQAHVLPTGPGFGPKVEAGFQRDQKEHVLVYLGFGEAPEEPEPPEPGSEAEIKEAIAAGLRKLADLFEAWAG